MQYLPPPRYITQVDPAAPSQGAEIAKLAKLLGKPGMPWQKLVWHGGTALNPDGTYRFPLVLITVPRQSGKTTLTMPTQLHRIITRPRIKAFYTAQTGQDATKRMLDLINLTNDSPLAGLFKARYAAGSAGLTGLNGSQLRTYATAKAIHGETPHLVTNDEIWAFTQAQGADFQGAVGPAQITLAGQSQWWLISTAGTSESVWLNELMERGRAGAPGMFYAEWSMPDGLDPYDPKTWWLFHPALGNTITEEALQKEAEALPFGEWMRAYMNRLTIATDPIISEEDWKALAKDSETIPAKTDIAITYEVAAGNDAGVVMASWRDEDGSPCVRVLHAAPGTQWMHDLVIQLIQTWKPAITGADDGGPTRRITDELRRTLNDPEAIVTTSARDFGTACEAFLSYARDKQLKHDGSKTLAHGMQHLVLKQINDVTRFSRNTSTGPIHGPVAAAVGLWLYDHQDNTPGAMIL